MAKVGKQKTNRVRLILLAALVFTAFLLSCVRLMQYQIVEGATYRETANKKTISTVSVKAARGEIVDRYGRSLAINKVAFNIVFDRVFMPEGRENEIIASLIDLMEDSGEEWVDELPITDQKPYQFEEGRDQADITRAKKTLGLNTYATAQNCIDELIDKYEIKGYSEERPGRSQECAFPCCRRSFLPLSATPLRRIFPPPRWPRSKNWTLTSPAWMCRKRPSGITSAEILHPIFWGLWARFTKRNMRTTKNRATK